MLIKIKVGQIWFQTSNPANLHPIIKVNNGMSYSSNKICPKFAFIDKDNYTLGHIVDNGWHYKWDDVTLCVHDFLIKNCPSCSLPEYKK